MAAKAQLKLKKIAVTSRQLARFGRTHQLNEVQVQQQQQLQQPVAREHQDTVAGLLGLSLRYKCFSLGRTGFAILYRVWPMMYHSCE